MKHIIKYIFFIIIMTSCLIHTSDVFIEMEKTITTQPYCVPFPAGYTFSWYDHTNMHHVADHVAPLWQDDHIIHNAGEFKPDARGTQIVFRDNNQGNVCAYAAFTIQRNTCAEIQQLIVHADYRRRGLASNVMQCIESYAAANGCTYLSLAVRQNNQAAIAAYKQQGYTTPA